MSSRKLLICFVLTTMMYENFASDRTSMIIAQNISNNRRGLVLVFCNPNNHIMVTSGLFGDWNKLKLFNAVDNKEITGAFPQSGSSSVCDLSSEYTLWTYPEIFGVRNALPAIFYVQWEIYSVGNNYVSDPIYFANSKLIDGIDKIANNNFILAKDTNDQSMSFMQIVFNDTNNDIVVDNFNSPTNNLTIKLAGGGTYYQPITTSAKIILKPGEKIVNKIDLDRILRSDEKFNPDDFNCGITELIWTITMPTGETIVRTFRLAMTDNASSLTNVLGYRVNQRLNEIQPNSPECLSVRDATFECMPHDMCMSVCMSYAMQMFGSQPISGMAIGLSKVMQILIENGECFLLASPALNNALSLFSVENADKLNNAWRSPAAGQEWRDIVRGVMQNITNDQDAQVVWNRCWELLGSHREFTPSDYAIMLMLGQLFDSGKVFVTDQRFIIKEKIRTINNCNFPLGIKAEMLTMGLAVLSAIEESQSNK